MTQRSNLDDSWVIYSVPKWLKVIGLASSVSEGERLLKAGAIKIGPEGSNKYNMYTVCSRVWIRNIETGEAQFLVVGTNDPA